MLTLVQLLATVEGLKSEQIAAWIGEGFVVPDRIEGEIVFAEIDVARVRLIYELETDLALDNEAVALLLSLLDKVYTLRNRVRALSDAIAKQSPEVQEAIFSSLIDSVGRDPER